MPRARNLIRKRYHEDVEVLGSELEETLCFGFGVLGVSIELRTLDDWKRQWARWRSVIEPKFREHVPGRRPFAQYVVGELPARPIVVEPPRSSWFFEVYVPGPDGTGQKHYAMPEPYMENEADYLYRLGVVDRDEMKRYRASLRKSYPHDDGSQQRVGHYPLEVGLHH